MINNASSPIKNRILSEKQLIITPIHHCRILASISFTFWRINLFHFGKSTVYCNIKVITIKLIYLRCAMKIIKSPSPNENCIKLGLLLVLFMSRYVKHESAINLLLILLILTSITIKVIIAKVIKI